MSQWREESHLDIIEDEELERECQESETSEHQTNVETTNGGKEIDSDIVIDLTESAQTNNSENESEKESENVGTTDNLGNELSKKNQYDCRKKRKIVYTARKIISRRKSCRLISRMSAFEGLGTTFVEVAGS